MTEKILHACLRYKSRYYLDKSHDLCYKQINKVDNSPIEIGFMTNKNRFVDRKEGSEIAFKSNQLNHKPTLLFSEHFWSEIYSGKYIYLKNKGYVLKDK